MEHLPEHQPMPPVVRVVDRQDAAQEVMDEPPELLGRRRRLASTSASSALEPATMRIQHRLDVELLLVAEVIVHRRDVRPGPLADRRGSAPHSNPFSANSSPAASSNRTFVGS